ncbi:DUF1298 domain-containing protein [Mycolicibacterium litorale]|nr:DUF1298 domain-containing protein [Mycolicibacterium litorale]
MPASRTMTAVDAQMLWSSAKIPNDQFLLYAFDGSPAEPDAAVEELRTRAEACDELRLRVVEQGSWRYPRWERGDVRADQFAVHHGDGVGWGGCLDTVTRLAADQLELSRMSWRAHVFPHVVDVPGLSGIGAVVVLQVGHALGDGNRSGALAGALLGRPAPVPVPPAVRRGVLPIRAVAAARAHRALVRDIEAGRVPPPAPSCPVRSVNQRPRGTPVLRTTVVHRDQLGGPTVTVAALVAIADALAGYLTRRGEDPSGLGAEVPMAGGRNMLANNNFRNVGIGLHPDLDRRRRAEAIVTELAAQRARSHHPAMLTAAAAFAATPAPLLRWGVQQFDPDVRSQTVTGNTVVSSVNRGPADLVFGGCPVVLTAGYPALSPMMSLTHGVHGIGDTIAISVHADPANIDVDDYLRKLRAALAG